MKKCILFVLGICALTTACATSETDGMSLGTVAKMRTCLTERAMQTVTDGSLYTNGVTATAKTIANSCVQSLALESLGIDSQATTMATTILSTLSAAKAQ